MPDSNFLETYALYRKFDLDVTRTLDGIPKPRINMFCETCSEVRTFVMTNEHSSGYSYTNYPSENATTSPEYLCVSCQTFKRHFQLKISSDLKSLMKIGQYPAWSIKPDKDISKMLGSHKSYITKGMICESQSYGIAAFSYYRRITEEIIDSLIDDIGNMISEDKRETYAKALIEVRNTRVTAEKIELVKDLLPPVLRPKNMNPLALLHGVLSEGLHAQSDDDCLELAVEVREILTFLASQVAIANASAQSFSVRMQTLLDKRSKA